MEWWAAEAAGLAGIAAGVAVLVKVVRSRRRRSSMPPFGGPSTGGSAGDRFPRRPLAPAGSAAASFEEPIGS